MTNGNEFFAEYPNAARFSQLAIDSAQTEFELTHLRLEHKARQVRYTTELANLEQHRRDLYEHTQRDGLSDCEEAERRKKIRELTETIAAYPLPEPVNIERYRVQKAMLEHKLRETAYLTMSLLIWQLQNGQN